MKEWMFLVLVLCVVAVRQIFQVVGTLRAMRDQDHKLRDDRDA